MDPNETLRRIRALIEENAHPAYAGVSRPDVHEELEELVTALDQWLSSGGFPPAAWHHVG